MNAGHRDSRPNDGSPEAIDIVPVGLRVAGKPVLVVGAGRIAARKAVAYASQGALITVVAPEHGSEMAAVAATRVHREFRAEDLDGQWLVVTATGLPAVDGLVFAEAEKRRIWCNAADDPSHCSLILPAVVRRDALTISISTGGRSPATASWLRRRIERLLDDDTIAVFNSAARVRDRMRAAGQPTEVSGWSQVLDNEALAVAAGGQQDELIRRLAEAVGAKP